MKPALFVLVAALAFYTAPASAANAPFGCGARAPNICHFRIFYARGDRIVILPSGMQTDVPGITIGTDKYCVSLNENPDFTCKRKLVDTRFNG